MKRVGRQFTVWLVVAILGSFGGFSASGATLTSDCANAIAFQDSRYSPSRSFEKWLREESNRKRFADYWLGRAIEFAENESPALLSHQTNRVTTLKFSPMTNEILILVGNKIIFYEELHQNSFADVSPREFYDRLCQSNLRGQTALPSAKPFHPFSRSRHFVDHGEAVAAENEVEYEEAAIHFATHAYEEGLMMDVVVPNKTRTVKIDLTTGEFGAYSMRDNSAITYFVRERHHTWYFLMQALPSKPFR
jgi:hypothetical protein